MDLQDQLMEDMKASMKAGDKVRTSVIRMLRTDLKNARIAKGDELDEEETLDLIARYARKRRESAKAYREGEREGLAAKEEAELAVVQTYLPEALGEDQLRVIVDEVVDSMEVSGMKHMGAVMKEVLSRAAGRAEGGAVSALVKARLMR